jgi:hypothetical protein
MLMIFDKNFGMVVVRITKVMIAVKLGEQFIDSIKLPVFFLFATLCAPCGIACSSQFIQ